MAVADKVARVHCTCKVGFAVNSTERNCSRAMYRLLGVVLPFLRNRLPGKRVQSPTTSHFSFPFLFLFARWLLQDRNYTTSKRAAMIGMDVKFQCQDNIPGGNYDSVYWCLQRLTKAHPYLPCLSRHPGLGTLPIFCGQSCPPGP